MRVIAGLYRSRILRSPADSKIRPTSDRLRERIFNIIQPQIDEETRFLDLCAGTGSIGIEALSRGCCFSAFVDISKRSCALIETNLDMLNVPDESFSITNSTAEHFAAKEIENGFDLIYFDPPYENDYSEFLSSIGYDKAKIMNETGLLMAEHHSKKILPDSIGDLRRWRLVEQGETNVSFYQFK